MDCYKQKYPNQPTTTRFLAKQMIFWQRLQQLLNEMQPELEVSDYKNAILHLDYDKSIRGSIRRRPDILITTPNLRLVIEFDEEQHNSYSIESERLRDKDIVDVFQLQLPIVFIRFNPDEYVDSDGVSHPSCFDDFVRTAGTYSINRTEWNTRFEMLLTTLRHYLFDTDPDTLDWATQHILFYDAWNNSKVENNQLWFYTVKRRTNKRKRVE